MDLAFEIFSLCAFGSLQLEAEAKELDRQVAEWKVINLHPQSLCASSVSCVPEVRLLLCSGYGGKHLVAQVGTFAPSPPYTPRAVLTALGFYEVPIS